MDMIERAAKALDDVYDISPRGELKNNDACVRAVLLAIREPTPEMVIKGDRAFRKSIRFDKAALAWQAMIDAALGETP